MSVRARSFSITLNHVWLAAAFALLLVRPLLTPIQPFDFWWHMATGRLIIGTGQIPIVDTFSYTQAGQPFFNQSWLAQVGMYGLYQVGGLPLIILIQAVVIALAYGLLLWVIWMHVERLRLAVGVLLLVAMPLSFDNWSIRPQSYAFPLFAAMLAILTADRAGRRAPLWGLPLLMALWVNIHGSFVLGLALIGIHIAGRFLALFRPSLLAAWEQPRPLIPLIGWGIATGAATLLNPRSIEVIGYVRNLLGSSQVTTLVTEWAPPNLRDFGGVAFFVVLIGGLLLMAYMRRPPAITDLLLLCAFTWLALAAVRNIVWFGFVMPPLIAYALAASSPRTQQQSQGSTPLNAIMIGLLVLLVGSATPWVKPSLFPPEVGAIVEQETPIEAVAFLQQQQPRPKRLFHPLSYGSYLIWAAPDQPVFIDPRIELYPYPQWVDLLTLNDGSDVQKLLDRYQFDALLLSRQEQRPLIEALSNDPAWQERYRDQVSVYIVRVR